MTDYADLEKRLRGWALAWDAETASRQLYEEAADALASRTRELEEAKAQLDDANDKLARVRQWADAYPEDVFFPVSDANLRYADSLLREAGISMSAMHGGWARHIVSGIAGIVGDNLSRAPSGEEGSR